VDDKGFGRIRSKGDAVLFGGHTTEDMKRRLGVKDNRPLAENGLSENRDSKINAQLLANYA
jgi:hypothetical protein